MKWLMAFLVCGGCATPSKTEPFCLPKRITRALMLVFPLAFAVTSRAADLPEGIIEQEVHVACSGEVCALSRAALLWLKESNAAMAARIKELEDARDKPPKCAELEVVPKRIPHDASPAKHGERDS